MPRTGPRATRFGECVGCHWLRQCHRRTPSRSAIRSALAPACTLPSPTTFDTPSRSRLNAVLNPATKPEVHFMDDRNQFGDAHPASPRTSPEDRRELRYYDVLTVIAATTAVAVNFLALKVARFETPLG